MKTFEFGIIFLFLTILVVHVKHIVHIQVLHFFLQFHISFKFMAA